MPHDHNNRHQQNPSSLQSSLSRARKHLGIVQVSYSPHCPHPLKLCRWLAILVKQSRREMKEKIEWRGSERKWDLSETKKNRLCTAHSTALWKGCWLPSLFRVTKLADFWLPLRFSVSETAGSVNPFKHVTEGTSQVKRATPTRLFALCAFQTKAWNKSSHLVP